MPIMKKVIKKENTKARKTSAREKGVGVRVSEDERRLICFLKEVFWGGNFASHFPLKEEEDKERDDENCVFVKGKKEEKEVSFDDASS